MRRVDCHMHCLHCQLLLPPPITLGSRHGTPPPHLRVTLVVLHECDRVEHGICCCVQHVTLHRQQGRQMEDSERHFRVAGCSLL